MSWQLHLDRPSRHHDDTFTMMADAERISDSCSNAALRVYTRTKAEHRKARPNWRGYFGKRKEFGFVDESDGYYDKLHRSQEKHDELTYRREHIDRLAREAAIAHFRREQILAHHAKMRERSKIYSTVVENASLGKTVSTLPKNNVLPPVLPREMIRPGSRVSLAKLQAGHGDGETLSSFLRQECEETISRSSSTGEDDMDSSDDEELREIEHAIRSGSTVPLPKDTESSWLDVYKLWHKVPRGPNFKSLMPEEPAAPKESSEGMYEDILKLEPKKGGKRSAAGSKRATTVTPKPPPQTTTSTPEFFAPSFSPLLKHVSNRVTQFDNNEQQRPNSSRTHFHQRHHQTLYDRAGNPRAVPRPPMTVRERMHNTNPF